VNETPIVDISLGRLRGRSDNGTHRFLGIPYAAPPIGPLRFAAPERAHPWSGERAADRFGPAPIQIVDDLSLQLGLLVDHPQSEDCLHLNIFTPDGELPVPRPVMVWIHGGAFASGAASGPVYEGSRLAKDGDVVVVTLNYRVGALGFLGVGVPNRGLQDQIAALRFVQNEIAAFGGDPENVTVFGESAGAGSLVALLAMPSARGLFHRAIIQSAAPEGILSRDEGQQRVEIFSQAAGDPGLDLDGLRRLSVADLLASQAKCQEPGPRRIGMFFAPIVDGDVLPEIPLEAIARGSARDVSVIIGTTAQEMQLYHLSGLFPAVPIEQIPYALAAGLPGTTERALEAANDLMPFYSGPELTEENRHFAAVTDANIFVPSAQLATEQARHNPETFMYRFCWPSPMLGGRLAACHALDIPFALGTLDVVPAFAGVGADASHVSDSMRAAWVSFARTGKPECPQVGPWPAYDSKDRATLIIDQPCRLEHDPDRDKRSAWSRARQHPNPSTRANSTK
jgi:para-nitrobenzyl esterase